MKCKNQQNMTLVLDMEIFLNSKKNGETFEEAQIKAKEHGYLHGPPSFVVSLRHYLKQNDQNFNDKQFIKLLRSTNLVCDIMHNLTGAAKGIIIMHNLTDAAKRNNQTY